MSNLTTSTAPSEEKEVETELEQLVKRTTISEKENERIWYSIRTHREI